MLSTLLARTVARRVVVAAPNVAQTPSFAVRSLSTQNILRFPAAKTKAAAAPKVKKAATATRAKSATATPAKKTRKVAAKPKPKSRVTKKKPVSKPKTKKLTKKPVVNLEFPKPPKRALSAFFYYLADERASTGTVGGIAQTLAFSTDAGAKWRAMSPTEQLPYLQRAQEAMAKYKEDHVAWRESLTPEQSANFRKAFLKRRERKGAKDPETGKRITRSPTAANLFVKDMYPKVVVEHPELKTSPPRMMEIQRRWKELSESEKAVYEARAAEIRPVRILKREEAKAASMKAFKAKYPDVDLSHI